jgi:hypothetical protein
MPSLLLWAHDMTDEKSVKILWEESHKEAIESNKYKKEKECITKCYLESEY